MKSAERTTGPADAVSEGTGDSSQSVRSCGLCANYRGSCGFSVAKDPATGQSTVHMVLTHTEGQLTVILSRSEATAFAEFIQMQQWAPAPECQPHA